MNKIVAHVGKSALSSKVAAYEAQDPYYETYTDAKGKERRRKRSTPAGLSERDAKILRKVRKRAHYLDKGFTVCGFRFGWTFLIGLIPVAGDVADFALGYKLVIKLSEKAEIPPLLKSRMVANSAIGAGIGLIPFVGDVIMATYRPNSRNAHLLEKFLAERVALETSPTAGSAQEQQAAAGIIDRFKSFGFSKKTGEPLGPDSTTPAAAAASGSNPPSASAASPNETARKHLVATGSEGHVKCSVCSKVFEGEAFGIQHVANKHSQLLSAALV